MSDFLLLLFFLLINIRYPGVSLQLQSHILFVVLHFICQPQILFCNSSHYRSISDSFFFFILSINLRFHFMVLRLIKESHKSQPLISFRLSFTLSINHWFHFVILPLIDQSQILFCYSSPYQPISYSLSFFFMLTITFIYPFITLHIINQSQILFSYSSPYRSISAFFLLFFIKSISLRIFCSSPYQLFSYSLCYSSPYQFILNSLWLFFTLSISLRFPFVFHLINQTYIHFLLFVFVFVFFLFFLFPYRSLNLIFT